MAWKARILVVDDVALLADTLCELLAIDGMEAVGPAPNVSAAMRLLASADIDAAILDIQLGQETSFPVARVLTGRRIPFFFLTSCGNESLPAELNSAPFVSKPFQSRALLEALTSLLRHPSNVTPQAPACG